ncbi:wax ester/triacylglycerol synthase domain-containing protein [Rhodococcus qingshengii]|uniref:wax ester/triacylglycerol synthase domain-containing protein n=1 Tax=Rhodococcus qingshengii TaxID=334542 RepID=UPI003D2926FB
MQVFDCDDSGNAPSARQIREHLAQRMNRIPILGEHLEDDPVKLDYPYRVADSSGIDSHINEVFVHGKTWNECMRDFSKLMETRLDPYKSLWQVHVLREIMDVPGSRGPATALVFQFSHCATDGLGSVDLVRALLASTQTVCEPAPDDLASRPRLRHSMFGAVRGSYNSLRLASQTAGNYVRSRTTKTADTIELPIPGFLAGPSLGRPMSRTFPLALADLRVPGFTITETLATAISLAIERYAKAFELPIATYRCNVPVALPPRSTSRDLNRISPCAIDLHVLTEDLTLRASSISQELRDGKQAATSAAAEKFRSFVNQVPAPALRIFTRIEARKLEVPCERVSVHTKLASYRAGPADTTLAGAPVLFASSLPSIGFNIRLAHNAIGLGDTVCISITAAPEAIADIEFYEKTVRSSIVDVVTALRLGVSSDSSQDEFGRTNPL